MSPTPRRLARIHEVLDRRQPDLTVLMERVHKPHNFSAVLRSCEAVGVVEAHAVRPRGGVELHHDTAAGATRWVRVREHADTAAAAAWLREEGHHLVAAHPTAGAVPYTEADLTGPVALLLGAELHGLSDEALGLADQTVVIPMVGMVRSLNVSVAAALLLFEARRQRAERGLYDAPRLDPALRDELLFEWSHPRQARRLRERGEPYPDPGPLTDTGG